MTVAAGRVARKPEDADTTRSTEGMRGDMDRRLNFRAFPAMALFALGAGCGGGSSPSATTPPPPADPDAAVVALKTATPIKHVIIIVGENRSFDHVFATYAPVRPE